MVCQNYIKHSKKFFIQFVNTSKLVSKTRLLESFNPLIDVLNCDETLFPVFDKFHQESTVAPCNAAYVLNAKVKLLILFSDRLGPLWPVIGILIEALVLFLIIFFAERWKKKKESGMERLINIIVHSMPAAHWLLLVCG